VNPRSSFRLLVLHVLVVSLLVSLGGRLWYLQVLNGQHYQRVAAENRTRDIVVPAVRGQILDDVGRPLVRNRTALVVSVDRTALSRQPDGGTVVLRRLAKVLGTKERDLSLKTRLCGPTVQRPCWPGSPYQPIPVDDRATPKKALQIMERQEDFPGVTAQLQAIRTFPRPEDAGAAQALGYLQPITQEELDKRKGLKVTGFSGVDLVGRDGLEGQYDSELRGEPGVRTVNVDSKGRITGTAHELPAQPGGHLVTSLDAGVQSVVEKAVQGAIKKARKARSKADTAAGVVLDVRTGRVVALASYPTYDPSIWAGGVTQKQYDDLLGKAKGQPLISRAVQGQFAPGSTFKVSSIAAAVKDGNSLTGTYSCPGSFNVGNRAFRNFEGVAHGSMNLHRGLVVSCDTIFYKFAYDEWLRDGGVHPGKKPKDPMVKMAKSYGFGSPTGIDLPNESSGRIPDRAWKKEFWKATKESNCKHAKSGYSGMNPSRAAYLKAIAAESCAEGYVWRAGDAANFAVGQGDVLVTPLQLARAYAAVANGGTLWSPRLGRAVMAPDGRVIREIDPAKAGKLPVSGRILSYVRKALADVPKSGTAAGAFNGFDFGKVAVAGKTGTAEVFGKKDTSWFASFAPAKKPQYAVVVMVSEAGTGGTYAAPAVREIYEGMYGLAGRPAALPGGAPPGKLPKVNPDGSVAAPAGYSLEPLPKPKPSPKSKSAAATVRRPE
jgi:penicillin-binding protein 2